MLLAVACQPVPQPFAPEHKNGPGGAGVVLSPRAGLVVQPLAGVTEAAAAALSPHLVEALWRHDFTATTHHGHRGSARLEGRVTDGAAIEWRIVDAGGEVQAVSLQRLDTARGAPNDYGQAEWRALAEAAAEALDRAMNDRERGSNRRLQLAAVAVGPIDGAPGNGRHALTAELRRALRDAGVPTPRDDEDDALMLIGSVHLGPDLGARREVEVIWQLIRPDGVELGRIAQSNSVPASQLNGAWGTMARSIAEAATEGIVDLLRRLAPERLSGAKGQISVMRAFTGPRPIAIEWQPRRPPSSA